MVVRWRWLAAAVALGVLALLIVPVFGIKIGQAQTASLASQRQRTTIRAQAVQPGDC